VSAVDSKKRLRLRGGRQAGAVMAEMGLVLPLLLIVMLAGIDLGRLVYSNQILTDLTREAAMLVSRGATSNEAFVATFRADAPLDVQADGGIIISRVRRKDANDASPWVFTQERGGALTSTSRVGVVGGPAVIPNVTSIAPGVTIMAVEVLHPFAPVFNLAHLGVNMYPDVVYEAAYF
jgi:Flp pilus assembly protein TadG